jgi:TfoX/Sxy family transcriptional regulator of competence genes
MLSMAYDEALADRVRELVGDEAGLAEQRMFGGLAFLVNGNMAVAASGQGGLLVRVDPEQGDELIDGDQVRPMEMRGREMSGWLRVDSAAVGAPDQLETWVARGVTYARSLPAKKSRR